MVMTRRDFIRTGAVGAVGGAATVAGLTGSAPANAAPSNAAPSNAAKSNAGGSFAFEEATIVDLQTGLEQGRWTSRDLVEAYLSRIEKLDRHGPSLNHVLETNPDALRIAEESDQARRDRGGKGRGPLDGIPIMVKDNLATDDRMMTTAGSLALVGARVPRDAHAMKQLREAGAVLIGKTNLSEWANFRSTQSSSGWSGRGGQTKNPYALDRSPCGSSSGSGGAVSANLCAAAVGTETDGSVVCPSSINGIVGIKPTLGLVSRSGIVPIAHSQDTAGPMARTVADAAALLSGMTGIDPRDSATAPSKDHRRADYTEYLRKDGLRGARIGVTRKQYFGYSPESDAIAEEAIEALKSAGATIVDPADLPTAGEFDAAEFEVLLYEFKADLNAYLAELGPESPVKSMADVMEFNRRNHDREMTYFGQEIMEMAIEKGPLTEQAYLDARETCVRLTRAEGIDKVMDEHNLDALFAPTGSPAWPIDLINGDHYIGASSGPAAVSGYPAITVPAGHSFGLPVGCSFYGRAWSEPKLIAIAYAFEQTVQARRVPQFRASIGWG